MADVSFANPIDASAERSAPPPVEFVGGSARISRVHDLVRRAASLETGVLLVAERGTDVEVIAREVHARSARASGPFIHVECSTTDLARFDRLLLGAVGSTAGDLDVVSSDCLVAAATGGTLFLQDVTEVPAAVQTRLARIVRDGEVRIDGEVAATNLRLIASALPSIDSDVRAQRFRSDLYRRLASSRIDVPALRERPDDVPALAVRLLAEACEACAVPPRTFTKPALALFAALTWPGNLAELRGVIHRVVAGTEDPVLQTEHLLPALALDRARATFTPSGNLREARLKFERDYISAVLQHHGWRMAEAAQTLGIQRPNLYRKVRQLGIPLTRLSE